jgi:hypothetical protein
VAYQAVNQNGTHLTEVASFTATLRPFWWTAVTIAPLRQLPGLGLSVMFCVHRQFLVLVLVLPGILASQTMVALH